MLYKFQRKMWILWSGVTWRMGSVIVCVGFFVKLDNIENIEEKKFNKEKQKRSKFGGSATTRASNTHMNSASNSNSSSSSSSDKKHAQDANEAVLIDHDDDQHVPAHYASPSESDEEHNNDDNEVEEEELATIAFLMIQPRGKEKKQDNLYKYPVTEEGIIIGRFVAIAILFISFTSVSFH